jgi:hypothetical protein
MLPGIHRGSALAGLCLLTTLAFALVGSNQSQKREHAQTPSSGKADNASASMLVAPLADRVQVTPSLDPERRLIAEPAIPRPAGTPCRVELFRDRTFEPSEFRYRPPVNCPGPWAKVILVLRLSGPRPENGSTASLNVELGDNPSVLLFMGAPQIHEGQQVWRLERDITDYASLLAQEQFGETYYRWDNTAYGDDQPTITGTATLLFYPPSPSTPAPRIPDRVANTSSFPQSLPRNIERAYVDVIAQAVNNDDEESRFWYSCVPGETVEVYPALISMLAMGDYSRAIFSSPGHGCRGKAYREVEVHVDGQRAGLAPVFPWLPSDAHDQLVDTVNHPVPGVHSVNFVPYRIDLTPFAGLLSDGAKHLVEVVPVSGGANAPSMAVDGTLLLYLDPDSTQVTGEVVRNTLAGQPAEPTVQQTLSPSGDHLVADIDTTLSRDATIEGYVDTSRGRIRSVVELTTAFSNDQPIELDGLTFPNLRAYAQRVYTGTTVRQHSRRFLDGTLLSMDSTTVKYSQNLNYDARGVIEPGDEGYFFDPNLFVFYGYQVRQILTHQFRRGSGHYYSKVFNNSDFYRELRLDVYDTMRSKHRFSFEDSRGSCYRKRLIAENGVVSEIKLAGGCPDNRNQVHWFARPDGSPSSMGWAE